MTALACTEFVAPCPDEEFAGDYSYADQTLVLDDYRFERRYPNGIDYGGMDVCGERVVLQVIARERNGMWTYSRTDPVLLHWVGAFRADYDSLYLSDGSTWAYNPWR